MEEKKLPSSEAPVRGADGHLVTCQHDGNCCVVPDKMVIKIGKHWATALSGFVAGILAASIAFIPWMVFQKTLAEESCFQKVQPPTGAEIMLEDGDAAAGTVLEGSEQPSAEEAPIQ